MIQAKYMINVDTNEVSAYKEKHVQERANFRPFYDDPPPIDKATGLCILRDKPDPLLAVEAQKKEAKASADDDAKHEALVDAMMLMQKIEFATMNGMPNLDKLEKAVGFKVTKEARQRAFEQYKLKKEVAG